MCLLNIILDVESAEKISNLLRPALKTRLSEIGFILAVWLGNRLCIKLYGTEKKKFTSDVSAQFNITSAG